MFRLQVNFSSLDVHLHTEALLNSMNFLNSLLPPPKKPTPTEQPAPPQEEEGEGDGEEEKKDEAAITKKLSKAFYRAKKSSVGVLCSPKSPGSSDMYFDVGSKSSVAFIHPLYFSDFFNIK